MPKIKYSEIDLGAVRMGLLAKKRFHLGRQLRIEAKIAEVQSHSRAVTERVLRCWLARYSFSGEVVALATRKIEAMEELQRLNK